MKILFLLPLMFAFVQLQAQRDTIVLNDNWQFAVDNEGTGLSEKWFEDHLSQSHAVHIPHTWNVEEDHQNHYGWGWYQRSIYIPKDWKSNNVVLVFGAVNHTALVYMNGKKIYQHAGDGFNKFFVPLNDAVLYGKDNLLTVAVNNAYTKTKVPYGTSFDWPNDGGIIRPVRLIVSGKPAVAYIHATPVLNVEEMSGKLNVKLIFAEQDNLRFHVEITEENQPTRKLIFDKDLVAKWKNNTATFDIALPKVHPWHFDFPNLYRVDVTVYDGKKAVDKVSTNVGFREFKLKDGKVYLNGEHIKLMGVEWTAGSHPDYGFAEPESYIIAMGKLMKNVNCIFSRQHFQQGEVFYDFCDRNGILVQQEVPLWGGETPANDTIQSIALQQLDAMVMNLYNHPSIFSWGVGNELRARDKDMKQMISVLLNRARELDPSRYTAYVSNTLTNGFYNTPGFVPDAAAEGDYIMMNEYGGSWWQLPTGEIGMYLDSVHHTYPKLPFFISEFGLCEPNFFGGDERRIQDMIYHMSLYESKPFIQGAIYFDLTDYRTHYPGTHEDNKYRRRVHGVYDMYGHPKPSMKVLREYSSPVEIHSLNKRKEGELSVTLFGNIGLPQHTVRGYKLYLSNSTGAWKDTKAYDLPEISPGERVDIAVDDLYKGAGIITIVRPTGYVVTQKSFYWRPEDQ